MSADQFAARMAEWAARGTGAAPERDRVVAENRSVPCPRCGDAVRVLFLDGKAEQEPQPCAKCQRGDGRKPFTFTPPARVMEER